jgi:hypothetical protein
VSDDFFRISRQSDVHRNRFTQGPLSVNSPRKANSFRT